MHPTFQRVALAAVLGLSLVVAAAAQDRAPGGNAPLGPRGGDRQRLFEDMRQRREQRLHDLLQIRPDQEAAFRTFVSSLEQLRPQRQRGLRQRGPEAEGARLTTPERLDRALQRLAEAQQRLQKEATAVKTFYAALSPEQRKAFDQLPVMRVGGAFGGRAMPMRGRFDR
jgi:Spy/CpxP family protein refolding chaperone